MERPVRRPHPRRSHPVGRWVTLALSVAAAIGVLQFHHPDHSYIAQPAVESMPIATPSPNALGRSGEMRVRMAMPGDTVEIPLEVQGSPDALVYQWLRYDDGTAVDSARPLVGARLVAPAEPGFYQLEVQREGGRRLVEGLTLSVLVPFEEKRGPSINGYRIGTYIAERLGAPAERPAGFLEVVSREMAALPLSTHFRVSDFLTRDGQQGWPRYAAVDPRLIDKLELVMDHVLMQRGVDPRLAGDGGAASVRVRVSAGYRSPAYNRTVPLAARNSRHQFGDAADVAIDADGDGRFTGDDLRLVALAVEAVERDHPELVGGLGIYASRRYTTPYAHIDARGRRARWRG